jgi:hypothetical protein
MCGIAAGGPMFPWRDGSPLGDRAVNATGLSTEDSALIPDASIETDLIRVSNAVPFK